MASDRTAANWAAVFFELMENAEAVEDILQSPVSEISTIGKDNLRTCYTHFVGSTRRRAAVRQARSRARRAPLDFDDDGGAQNTEDSDIGEDGQRRTTGAWGSIQAMRSIPQPGYLQTYLARWVVSPETGISRAQTLMGDFFPDVHDQVGIRLGDFTETVDEIAQALKIRVTYSMDIQERSELDRVRQCFTYLNWYDIVAIIRPDIRGTRLGERAQEDIRHVLSTVYDDNIERDWLDKIMEQICQWYKMGYRLQGLCNQQGFSEGCIFLLAEKFSRHFLLNRFTLSGESFAQAMRHLEGLGLREKEEEAGLPQLAKEVRMLLSRPFERNLAAYIAQNVREREG